MRTWTCATCGNVVAAIAEIADLKAILAAKSNECISLRSPEHQKFLRREAICATCGDVVVEGQPTAAAEIADLKAKLAAIDDAAERRQNESLERNAMKTWTCATCGNVVDEDQLPVECIMVDGEWWHGQCAAIIVVNNEYRFSERPSPGRMIPSTILTEADQLATRPSELHPTTLAGKIRALGEACHCETCRGSERDINTVISGYQHSPNIRGPR